MKYFSNREFSCRCRKCSGLPEGGMNAELTDRLDALREEYGYPIMVSSGYRCPDHNKAVGGVSNSLHVQGRAADLYVDGNYQDFYDLVIESRLFDGVGYYPDEEFVHVDVRADGKKPNYYLW